MFYLTTKGSLIKMVAPRFKNFISMILNITKARVVKINKDKYKRRMNRLGKMFRLYWMGNIPQIIGKKRYLGYKLMGVEVM